VTGSTPSENEESVPVLVAAPNMTFDAVALASTALLAPPIERDDGGWISQPQGKHAFRLTHPTLGFELMPSLFSLIEASGRLVWRVRSTPHLRYATFAEAFEIVEVLGEKFVAASWEPRSTRERGWLERRFRRGTSLVARVYGPMPDIREKAEPRPSWRIEVEMRKAVDAGSVRAASLGVEGDAFLVTAVLANEPEAP
jgi:hypothetical protein